MLESQVARPPIRPNVGLGTWLAGRGLSHVRGKLAAEGVTQLSELKEFTESDLVRARGLWIHPTPERPAIRFASLIRSLGSAVGAGVCHRRSRSRPSCR